MENSRQTIQNTRCDLFYLNPLEKHFIGVFVEHWRWVVGLPCSGIEATFFRMGSTAWSSRALISQTWQMWAAESACWLAEMAKCVGVVDPSSSWASDVTVCDTVSGTSPYSFLVSKPRRSPRYIGCKASGSRWVYRVSVAQLRGQSRQGSEKAHLKPPVPSTPLPQALADQPETGAGAVEWMNVL